MNHLEPGYSQGIGRARKAVSYEASPLSRLIKCESSKASILDLMERMQTLSKQVCQSRDRPNAPALQLITKEMYIYLRY